MAELEFDVAVIGGGPGGYVCAIKAAQLGLKVVCIDKRKTLGGTCLNVGCIPSKALLHSTHLYAQAKHDFTKHGIKVSGLGVDLPTLMSNKDNVVEGLTKGIAGLFAKNKILQLTGEATLKSATEIDVKGKENKRVKAKYIVIATGSESMPLPGVEVDEKKIVTSTGALDLAEIPKKMVVIGGGYIGLEMGSVWSRLGTEVTVVEFLDRIVPGMDKEVGRNFHKLLEKQGFKFKLGTKVTGAKTTKKGVELVLEPAAGGKEETLLVDVALVSIGRRPYTENLGLEAVGVQLDARGFIAVDQHLRTSVSNIYAIGDVILGPMLAHKAEEDGVCVAEILAGQKGHVDYDKVPGVVYTHPEVACVGKTEEQLKEAGVQYNVGKFSFMANSRARSVGDADGFVKILADKTTDEILGAHIIGPDAGTLIAEFVLGMEFKAASEDIARTCHAHPTLNEAVKEAALATFFKPIHS